MRTALLSNRTLELAGNSRGAHIAPPLKGLNTRDPYAAMDPLYAVSIQNWYPGIGDIRVRGGAHLFASRAATETIKTLIIYRSGVVSAKKMFGCTSAGLYDVTAGGSYGAAVTTLTEGEVSYVNFTNSAGGAFLWGCNGADPVKLYDGTTWTDLTAVSVPAITGVATTLLDFCWIFKRRIFAVEEESMNAWFLPVDSIAGVASKFPVGALFVRGGHLLAGISWTLDGGNGPDDYCVFITSEGEIAVYAGTDPTSAATFALVGVFYVGKPIDNNCLVRVGGDVWVAAELGLIQLSKLVTGIATDRKMSVSDAIRPLWNAVYLLGTNIFNMTFYPVQNALIINTWGAIGVQLVVNVVTGAWTTFSWQPVHCYVVDDEKLYMSTIDGDVYQAWDGAVDPGDIPITSSVTQAYNYFGKSSGTTQVKLIRPIMSFNGATEVRMGIATDFVTGSTTTIIPAASGVQKSWRNVSANPGFAIAFSLQLSSSVATIATWSGTDYQLIDGSVM